MSTGVGTSRPRFRLLPTVLLTAAILLVPTAVYGVGRSSSSFVTDRIEVSGTHLTPKRKALRLLRHAYLGRNLFTVTAGDIARTLDPLPYVARVHVDRDFPDVLRVRVVEYRPVAYVLAGERWFALAADGYVIRAFKLAAATTPSPLPGETSSTAVVTQAASSRSATLMAGPPSVSPHLPSLSVESAVAVGDTLSEPITRAALPVIDGMPARLRRGLAVVELTPRGELRLTFSRGPRVDWGGAGRRTAKTLALTAVLERYASAGTRCTWVDVSVPNLVLAKPILK